MKLRSKTELNGGLTFILLLIGFIVWGELPLIGSILAAMLITDISTIFDALESRIFFGKRSPDEDV